MSELLLRLSKKHEVLVVSGADAKQIAHQVGVPLLGKYWSMGQSGNACIDRSGVLLWENKMNWLEKYEVLHYVHRIFIKKTFSI
jgi:hypothetical protein